jgi:hypothetical protein
MAAPFQAALICNVILNQAQCQLPSSIRRQLQSGSKRFEGTIRKHLQTIFHSNPLQDIDGPLDFIDSAIMASMAIHGTRGVSPSGLTFQHNMLHPNPILANFELIYQRNQALIDSNACCKNRHWIYQSYKVGDKVLVKVYNPTGLKQGAVSLFPIKQIHINGTLMIQRMPTIYEK